MNTIKRLGTVAAGLGILLGAGACATVRTIGPVSYTPPSPVAPVGPVSTSSTHANTSGLPGAGDTAKVGTTFQVQDSGGDTYDVTLVKVIDPAMPDSNGIAADQGKRLVGLVFKIKGVDGTVNDDADVDTAITGGNHQQYQPDFDPLAGYTDFNDGEFTVGPGQTSIGAVSFEVPDGVKVAAVTWQPMFNVSPGTWTVG